MLASITVVVLAGLISFADAQACTPAPYKSLSCLSGADAATDACSGVTKTIVKTFSSGTVTTETTSQDASSQVTVTDTTTSSTTVTITAQDSSTVTSLSTDTSLFSRTITTWTSAATTTAAARRNRIRQNGDCTSSDAIATLSSLSAGSLAITCSCLGVPIPTITQTTTAKPAGLRSTLTTTIGRPSTTTVHLIAGITFTETVTLPATTLYLTASTSLTATSTVALAAPTFTHVWGPEAGCIDTTVYEAYQLNNTITDDTEATQLCKGYCSQSKLCEMVYVQRVFVDWGSAMPYCQCQFNDHHLNSTDLDCGNRVGTWGLADAYDAYGRDVAE